MAIQGVLFDKDGTLIDYARTWVPINRRAAACAASGDAALAADLLRLNGQDPETGDIVPGSVLAAGSIAEIAAETAWLPHSVRGFLTAMVRKKLDLPLVSTKEAGAERRYHIAALKPAKE